MREVGEMMLEIAKIHESQLQSLFSRIVFDDKFKFYNASNYYDYNISLDNDSWNSLQFASVDKDGNVLGYLSAKISRASEYVSSLQVINFYELNYTFSKDFHQFITDLFIKFKFRKINFSVIIGNPAEKMYDKYIEKYNGRVVGIYKEDVRLFDGKYYDFKVYEIFKNEFEKSLK
jgi:hypothetical protein